MTILRPTLIALSITIVASSASAAHPFYVSMLERGVASATRGDHQTALRELQTAAFGLLGDLPRYELAQVHIALVSKRLGNEGLMRAATAKVAQVEQLEASYARIPLAPSVRAEFNTLAPTVLSPEQLALILPVVGTRATQVITNSTVVSPPAAAPPVVETVTDVAVVPASIATPRPAAPAAARPAAAPPAQPPAAPAVARPTPPAAVTVDPLAVRFRAAEALLDKRDLAGARRAYIMLLQEPQLQRAHLLALGRGLSRSGAWQDSALAYQRAHPLQDGEEIHMFHQAVSRYELGELTVARALMRRAAAKLPNTPEIAAYRQKIGVN